MVLKVVIQHSTINIQHYLYVCLCAKMCIRDRLYLVGMNQQPDHLSDKSELDETGTPSEKQGTAYQAVSYTHLDVYKRQVLNFVA